jgi:hypothetical protein
MGPITAIEMAKQAKIEPKLFRQALREENFAQAQRPLDSGARQ